MALGKRQKELIQKWWRSPVSGYHLDTYYSDRFFNSRETGRGYPVMIAIVHNEAGDVETRLEIARCQSEFECERKVTEIQNYISQLDDEWIEKVATDV